LTHAIPILRTAVQVSVELVEKHGLSIGGLSPVPFPPSVGESGFNVPPVRAQRRWIPQILKCVIIGENPGGTKSQYFYEEPSSSTEHGFQIFPRQAQLIHPKFDGLDRIRGTNGLMPRLNIPFHEAFFMSRSWSVHLVALLLQTSTAEISERLTIRRGKRCP
jgi:hypothetical protein